MIPIELDPSWPEGARMGFLEARGLPGLATHPALEEARRAVEARLRRAHAGADRATLKELPVMRVFAAHFKPSGQTYHMLRQLESVALKGRDIPSRICAVTALFMAELEHGIVAAGHDLDRLVPPLRMAASRAGESYLGLGGEAHTVPAGDLVLRHGGGILSSVLRGPDGATAIQPGTRAALYTLYAPAGIAADALAAQLRDLEAYLRLHAPDAALEARVLP